MKIKDKIIFSLIKNMRLPEISLMTCFGIVAALFIKSDLHFKAVFILGLASFTIVASIYSANSYLGYKSDRLNPRLSFRQFKGKSTYLILTLLFLLVSLVCWHLLAPVLVLHSLAFFLLWIIYSIPGGAKYRPIWGTVIHFMGVVLQFYMASIAFDYDHLLLLKISTFFGLLFAGGHIAHEIKDYKSDLEANIRTSAVCFGISKMTTTYKLITAFAALVWISFGCLGMVAGIIFWTFAGAIFLHLSMFIFIPKDLSIGNSRFQQFYRTIYLVAGLTSALSKF